MLEDDIDTLVELLQEYRVELVNAQDELSQKDAVIQSLQASLAAAHTNSDGYVQELEQALLELNARTESTDNDLLATQQQVAELEDNNKRLRQQLRELQTAANVQPKIEAESARQIAELEDDNQELRVVKRQLENQLDEYDLVISRQQDQIVDLSEQLRHAEVRLLAAVPPPPQLRRGNQLPSDEALDTTTTHDGSLWDNDVDSEIRERSPVAKHSQRSSPHSQQTDGDPAPLQPRTGFHQRARIFEILRRSKERRQIVPIVAEQELSVHIG